MVAEDAEAEDTTVEARLPMMQGVLGGLLAAAALLQSLAYGQLDCHQLTPKQLINRETPYTNDSPSNCSRPSENA